MLLVCSSLLVLLSGTGGATAQAPAPPGKGPGATYANVVVVAKAGGDFTSIQTALDSISPSPGERWLVWVAPGVYAERVQLKPQVDVVGAGEALVTISAPGSNNYTEGTVMGANDAGLSEVTVEATGGADYAHALYSSYASPRIKRVTARAWGGTLGVAGVLNDTNNTHPVLEDLTVAVTGTVSSATVYGVYNAYYSSPDMTRLRIMVTGTGRTYGVYNLYYSSPVMRDVDVTVANGGDESAGIRNGGGEVLERVNVRITAALGGFGDAYGIDNHGAPQTLRHVSVVATAPGGGRVIGISNVGTSPTMTDVTVTVSGGTEFTVGMVNSHVGDDAALNGPSSPVVIGSSFVVTGSGGIAAAFYNMGTESPVLRQVLASATGGAANYGIYDHSASSSVVNSAITASGLSGVGLYVANCAASTTVNASQIAGAANTISPRRAARCARVATGRRAGGRGRRGDVRRGVRRELRQRGVHGLPVAVDVLSGSRGRLQPALVLS
jgi:hypothetical protein